jgi:hypothetical protein
MTAPMTQHPDPTSAELRGLLAKATPGPWEVDSEHDGDAEYGGGPDPDRGYANFIVFDGKGHIVCDTLNSDAKCIEEEPHSDEDGYRSAWDGIGKANAALIVAAVNALPGLLDHIDRLTDDNVRLRALVEEAYREGWMVNSVIPEDHKFVPACRNADWAASAARQALTPAASDAKEPEREARFVDEATYRAARAAEGLSIAAKGQSRDAKALSGPRFRIRNAAVENPGDDGREGVA